MSEGMSERDVLGDTRQARVRVCRPPIFLPLDCRPDRFIGLFGKHSRAAVHQSGWSVGQAKEAAREILSATADICKSHGINACTKTISSELRA